MFCACRQQGKKCFLARESALEQRDFETLHLGVDSKSTFPPSPTICNTLKVKML